MNKNMSLKRKVLLEEGLMGIVWLALATIKVLKLSNTLKNIALVVLLVGIVISVGSMFIKCDKEDEMSKKNMLKAEANTYKCLKGIMLVGMLFTFRFKDMHFDFMLSQFINFGFGILLLLKAILFFYYEKCGE